jgi:hypothetical protein
MTNSRWTALNGVAAVVLFAGSAGLGASNTPGKSDQEIVSWWNDSGNRTRVWIGAALLALAAISFVWYASGLREILRRAGGERTAALAFGASLVFAALVLVAGAVQLSIPAAIDFGDNFQVDPNTARLIDPLTYLPIFGGAMMLSLTVGAATAAARRSGVLPRWLVIPGYVLAPALLLSVVFWGIPLAVFGLWVLGTCVAMVRGEVQEPSQRPLAAPA